MNIGIAGDAFEESYSVWFEGHAGSDAEDYANQHGIPFAVK